MSKSRATVVISKKTGGLSTDLRLTITAGMAINHASDKRVTLRQQVSGCNQDSIPEFMAAHQGGRQNWWYSIDGLTR